MHRVPGHEGKCAAFHGHRYAAEISVQGPANEIGMVIDFGVLRELLGSWIDRNWDHTAILMTGDHDPAAELVRASNLELGRPVYDTVAPPTAETLATILAGIAADLLAKHGVEVVQVRVWETPNCSAVWTTTSQS